jgi:hypothetical protein
MRPLVLALLCARKLADETNEMKPNRQVADESVLDALLRIAQRPDSDARWRELVAADLQPLIDMYAAAITTACRRGAGRDSGKDTYRRR